MRYFKYLLCLFAILFICFCVAPSPIDPAPLSFPSNELPAAESLPVITANFPRVCRGCEDVSFGEKGYVYTGHEDGRLLRFSLTGATGREQEIVRFKGRPLGLEVVGDSIAWVCVKEEGLARVDIRAGTYDILVSGFNDTLFRLIDYLDLDASGRVYFTDASDRYTDDDLQFDVLEGNPNGALYRYDPATGQTERLLDNLRFANGVAVSPDQSFVLVNETAGFRTQRYWLTGPRAGTAEPFIEGLPGWPDGISLGTDGLYYLTLISPRTGMQDFILPRPWTRRLAAKLPQTLWPAPIRENYILALNDEGQVVRSWRDEHPAYSSISSVERIGNTLWFGTVDDEGIGSCVVE